MLWPPPPSPTRAASAARWLGYVVATLVFVSSLLSAGAAYAFCPHAKRAMKRHGCCGAKHDAAGAKATGTKADPGPQLRKPKCCEVRQLSTLPAVDASTAPEIERHAAAPAVLPTPTATPPSRPSAPRARPAPPHGSMPIRAGPPRGGPETAAQRCARLCVYLR